MSRVQLDSSRQRFRREEQELMKERKKGFSLREMLPVFFSDWPLLLVSGILFFGLFTNVKPYETFRLSFCS